MGPVRFLMDHLGPPNSQKCKNNIYIYCGPYMNTWWLFFFLVTHMSALWWCITALKFSFTWVWRKAPQDPPPPNMKKYILFPFFGFKLKIFLYQIASIFYMYIDMGEMIADKQDRPSLIIEDPQGPKNSPKYKYLYILPHIWKTWFSNCFLLLYICFHCDYVWICWHVGAPGTHEFYIRPQPRKKNLYYFIFYILTQKVLIRLLSIFDMQLLLKRG